jgi:aspartate aminotransferase-like enzyme
MVKSTTRETDALASCFVQIEREGWHHVLHHHVRAWAYVRAALERSGCQSIDLAKICPGVSCIETRAKKSASIMTGYPRLRLDT